VADEPDESIDEPDGIAARLGRMALGPARAAARSGREALTGEAERAVEGMLSGPLPEAVARQLVEHHVVERALAESLETMTAHRDEPNPERERLARAVEQALAGPAFEQRATDIAERVVQTEGFKRALSATLESPEIRSALARQTAGFGAEIAASLRGRLRRLDDQAESAAHRALGRRPAGAASAFGGVATRGLALVVDLLLVHAVYMLAAGSVALIASLAGSLRSGWLDGAIAAAAWAVVAVGYFVFFWSTTGQTPGMRLMRLRVLAGSAGAPPSVWRSLVRFAGLILAILLLFLGFVPVLFDGRRRALQDYLAGTAVAAEP
jgi:uncharacterized RDD family membrane protein YckC